jgi:DNA-binding protein H-NS
MLALTMEERARIQETYTYLDNIQKDGVTLEELFNEAEDEYYDKE